MVLSCAPMISAPVENGFPIWGQTGGGPACAYLTPCAAFGSARVRLPDGQAIGPRKIACDLAGQLSPMALQEAARRKTMHNHLVDGVLGHAKGGRTITPGRPTIRPIGMSVTCKRRPTGHLGEPTHRPTGIAKNQRILLRSRLPNGMFGECNTRANGKSW